MNTHVNLSLLTCVASHGRGLEQRLVVWKVNSMISNEQLLTRLRLRIRSSIASVGSTDKDFKTSSIHTAFQVQQPRGLTIFGRGF